MHLACKRVAASFNIRKPSSLRAQIRTMAALCYEPEPRLRGAGAGKLSLDPSVYPEARRADVVEELHGGVRVADPYRWLEDPDAEEVQAFVDEQNRVTQGVLAQCPTRQRLKDLVTSLMDYERFSVPSLRGRRYYYSHNTGLQAQSVVYSQRSLEEPAVLLMDPNKLSDDGTVALGSTSFSECGSLWAYTLSSGGTDWRTLRFKRIDQETGETAELPDTLTKVKFTSLAWTHDSKGIFYNKYDNKVTGKGPLGTETDSNTDQLLMYHVLGRPQEEDVCVLAIPEHPTHMIGAELSHDGRFLIVSVGAGCEPTNKLWYVDLEDMPCSPEGALDLAAFDFFVGTSKLPVVRLVDDFRAQWQYIGSRGSEWTLQTNYEAPRYRIVRADVSSGTLAGLHDVIPQHERDLLEWARELQGGQGGVLAACFLRDVASVLQLHSFRDGSLIRQLPLPGLGSVTGFSGSHKHSEAFFSFSGFTEPGATYRFDAAEPEAEPTLFRRTATKGFDPDDFQTEQVFVTSKDGTQVPMFIVHRKGLQRDGRNPTLLYGYGGFNVSLTPSFSASRLAWMLAYNSVYAVANLRGGGEYGIEWRAAGSLGNKQNVFDDHQACAEYLATSGYCSPETLAIQGGSNGGLLVAACANQRPDLYGVVICQVGVLDMLRFHKWTIGHAWCTDYGNPDSEDVSFILPYSPVHNIALPSEGQMPATILTTGSHDDRVCPLHSHKLIASLQHMARRSGGRQVNPLLSRVEVRVGHGAGKPTAKIIEEVADVYAFAAAHIGAEWKHDG